MIVESHVPSTLEYELFLEGKRVMGTILFSLTWNPANQATLHLHLQKPSPVGKLHQRGCSPFLPNLIHPSLPIRCSQPGLQLSYKSYRNCLCWKHQWIVFLSDRNSRREIIKEIFIKMVKGEGTLKVSDKTNL